MHNSFLLLGFDDISEISRDTLLEHSRGGEHALTEVELLHACCYSIQSSKSNSLSTISAFYGVDHAVLLEISQKGSKMKERGLLFSNVSAVDDNDKGFLDKRN